MNPVIAIDGPAASGKSTVSKMVAKLIGFAYVDTGSMYRAFAWHALNTSIDITDRAHVKNLIQQSNFESKISFGSMVMSIRGQDPLPYVKSPAVTEIVSKIAAIPELREFLVIRQRQLRMQSPLVVEGRDIGTVVFPDTSFKFFLDANESVRAQRRGNQGEKDAIGERDKQDSSRKVSPMIMAADAIRIDSSNLTAEEVAQCILEQSRLKGLKA